MFYLMNTSLQIDHQEWEFSMNVKRRSKELADSKLGINSLGNSRRSSKIYLNKNFLSPAEKVKRDARN